MAVHINVKPEYCISIFLDKWLSVFPFIQRTEVDPLLGGTQTWKLSHWRFIKRDEKERKDTLYVYILSISYNHLFVKRESSLFSSCFSKSTGLRYPKEECLRFRL